MRRTLYGFTLLELLVGMAIVALLMAVGLPSYQYMANNGRISGEINGLIGDMQYARAEALKEGQNVTICSVANPAVALPSCACNGSSTSSCSWAGGWMVYSNPNGVTTADSSDPVLRVQPIFTGYGSATGDPFTAANSVDAVTFNRDGIASLASTTTASLAITSVTFTLNPSSGSGAPYERCLALSRLGRMKVQTNGTGNCT